MELRRIVGLLVLVLASGCTASARDLITGAASCDELAEPLADVVNEFASTRAFDAVEISLAAFLDDSMETDDNSALREQVAGWDGVESVTFFTKEDALVEFREIFSDQPALIEIVEEDPSILPASLRIRLDGTVGLPELMHRLRTTPGVFEVGRATDVAPFASRVWQASRTLRERYTLISDRAQALGCDTRDAVDSAARRGLLRSGVFADWLRDAIRSGTLQG